MENSDIVVFKTVSQRADSSSEEGGPFKADLYRDNAERCVSTIGCKESDETKKISLLHLQHIEQRDAQHL